MQFAYAAVCVPSDSSLIPRVLDMPELKASCLSSGFLIACSKEVHTEEMEEEEKNSDFFPHAVQRISWGRAWEWDYEKALG